MPAPAPPPPRPARPSRRAWPSWSAGGLRPGDEYRRLGLRERVLALPVMVGGGAGDGLAAGAVGQRGGPGAGAGGAAVGAAARGSASRRSACGCAACPAALFARRAGATCCPPLHARAAARTRPLPPVLARAQAPLPAGLGAGRHDAGGAVSSKVGLLRDGGAGRSWAGAGRRCWTWPPSCRSSSGRARPAPPTTSASWTVRRVLPPGTLLVLDRGFSAFPFFDWLTEHGRRLRHPRPRAARHRGRAGAARPRRPRATGSSRLGQYRSNPCAHPRAPGRGAGRRDAGAAT